MNWEHERLKQILAEAAALTASAERAAYLEVACAGAAPLRAEVEALLQAHDQAGNFLGPPLPQHEEQSGLDEGPGTVIGRYKLLEQIGEGGFGRVFMAEQQEPVRRKVALKIIKAGMDTREVIARFEAERQALALMDHPNIAKVLDGGTGGAPNLPFRRPILHSLLSTLHSLRLVRILSWSWSGGFPLRPIVIKTIFRPRRA